MVNTLGNRVGSEPEETPLDSDSLFYCKRMTPLSYDHPATDFGIPYWNIQTDEDGTGRDFLYTRLSCYPLSQCTSSPAHQAWTYVLSHFVFHPSILELMLAALVSLHKCGSRSALPLSQLVFHSQDFWSDPVKRKQAITLFSLQRQRELKVYYIKIKVFNRICKVLCDQALV